MYIILVKYVCMLVLANCGSQLLLDRLGICLKLIVSTDITSSHEVASQFGLAFFYTRKAPTTYREDGPSLKCLLNEKVPLRRTQSIDHQRPAGPATTRAVNVVIAATDWANTAKTASQNGNNESIKIYLHGLKTVV